MTELPDKMSDLIDVALRDLAACENDDRYMTDMRWHHISRSESLCYLRLTGAVMACSLEVNITSECWSTDFVDNKPKFIALEYLQCGYAADAAYQLGIALPDDVPGYFDITPYKVSPAQFKADMARMANVLRRHAL